MSKYPLFKLNDLTSEWCKGQPFKKTDIAEHGQTPCIHYGELFTKYGVVINQCLSKTDVQGKRLSVYGDILFPASDVTPSGLARCSALMQDNVILGGDIIIMRPRSGNDSRYLSYAINYQKEQILQRVTGALIKHLSGNALKSVVIPVPPLSGQINLVSKLEKTSALITFRKQQLQKLDQLASSRFSELLGNGDFPCRKLGTFCNVGSSKRVFVEELQSEGIPFFRGTEIGQLAEGKSVVPSLFITKSHYEVLCSYSGKPQYGDLLLPSICSDGRIWCVNTDNPFYFKDGRVLWVKVPKSVNGCYLRFALSQSIIRNYNTLASGITFAELKIISLKEAPVPVPPLELQNEFAAFVEQLDKSKVTIRKSIEKLETTYRALLQEYFG